MINMTGWQPQLTLPVSPARDHIRGPVAAPVTLVEYGDYECPYCAAAHAVVNAVQRADGRQPAVRVPPLSADDRPPARGGGGRSRRGGRRPGQVLADARHALRQPVTLEAPFLLAYAEAIGVDTARVAADLAEHVHAARVREDFMSGVRSGVNGTPSFFINGVRYDGSWEAPSLLAALQQVA